MDPFLILWLLWRFGGRPGPRPPPPGPEYLIPDIPWKKIGLWIGSVFVLPVVVAAVIMASSAPRSEPHGARQQDRHTLPDASTHDEATPATPDPRSSASD